MTEQKRKVYSAEFKAKVALEALQGRKTINEIGQEHGVHPVQVSQWKKEVQEGARRLFETKRGRKAQVSGLEEERLFGEIGRLKMELDWLKKIRPGPVAERLAWIDPEAALAVSCQCELAGVGRSSFYALSGERIEAPEDDELLRRIDEEYTRHPFYGTRRMTAYLREQGYRVNRKRVRRLMRLLGLAGMAPGPSTSRRHPQHPVFPYLLRGVEVVRPNQVWSTDITYIRLEWGFVYLVAVIDWYSRKALSWRLSNTLDAGFCIDCLSDALRTHGKPEVFNSDQGVQFTSEGFTGVLKGQGIKISMDGRGRALDNIFVERLWRTVKYEDVYLKGYATLPELERGLTGYFGFYNGERLHQGLGERTPATVYVQGSGGGARIAR